MDQSTDNLTEVRCTDMDLNIILRGLDIPSNAEPGEQEVSFFLHLESFKPLHTISAAHPIDIKKNALLGRRASSGRLCYQAAITTIIAATTTTTYYLLLTLYHLTELHMRAHCHHNCDIGPPVRQPIGGAAACITYNHAFLCALQPPLPGLIHVCALQR